MGGFEADGEGGYWESDQIARLNHNMLAKKNDNIHKPIIKKTDGIYSINAPAKVNIFLKITGHCNGYHTLLSRFARIDSLYDTISFIPYKCENFTIEGCKNIPLESNTIYRAYKALLEYTHEQNITEFFHTHKIHVKKRIPTQAGLGGGSSDAASFMHLTKEMCNLPLNIQELVEIGSKVGSDIPFFLLNYPLANVSGFGEIVTPFKEEPLELELYMPQIKCDTALVFKTFKEHFLDYISVSSFAKWDSINSKTLLQSDKTPADLNDLYKAALLRYPELKEIAIKDEDGWFFSGSGSTFFRIKN